MHEFSICQTLVDAVLTEMRKIGSEHVRLLKTRVVVGGLRQIVPEYLEQAYDVLIRDTVAEGSVLKVEVTPVVGKCEDCGWNGDITKGKFCCANCGSKRAQIMGGMELYLDNLEIEEEE